MKASTFYILCKKFCPRRSLEATRNYRYFIKNGLRPVDSLKAADLIIIHSCGGFNLDEKFSLLTVENALKNKRKDAKVILTGCLPKINKKVVLPFKDATIIPTENLSFLDSLIEAKIPYNAVDDNPPMGSINDLYHGTVFQRLKRKIKTIKNPRMWLTSYFRKKHIVKADNFFSNKVYKITITSGCLSNCTYCAIKFALPPFKSIQPDKIIEQFRCGLKQNYKYFALTGADIGAYGMDINSSLPKLLEKIFVIEGNYKINLVDLNGRWLVKICNELLAVLETNQIKINRIIIPIQSGSNHILDLMKRRYKIEDIESCISKFQERIPNIRLETHILVGFPGETEEDFQKSYDFLMAHNFFEVQIYKYEDRPNTVASKLYNKVNKKTINKRAKKLVKIGSHIICN